MIVFVMMFGYAVRVDALTYGTGSYGTCQYEECGITLTSSASVTLDVTPVGGSTRCTVASDTVAVTTSSSTGYTVTVSTSDSSNQLASGSGGSIAATSSAASSAGTLETNTWGYRVDGRASFGAGPTASVNSGAVPAGSFAFVPTAGAADVIMTSPSATAGTDSSYVWYGICVDSLVASGSYADNIVYTAVTN